MRFDNVVNVRLFFNGNFSHDNLDIGHLVGAISYRRDFFDSMANQLKDNLKSDDPQPKQASVDALEQLFYRLKNIENNIINNKEQNNAKTTYFANLVAEIDRESVVSKGAITGAIVSTAETRDNKSLDQRVNDILSIYYNKKDSMHPNKDSPIHGIGHIKTVVMIGDKLQELYKKHGNLAKYPINDFLKPEQQHLALIAVAFHDAGRVGEGVDHDELSSSLLLASYLMKEKLCDPQTAIKLAICTVTKGNLNPNSKEVKNLTAFLSKDIKSKEDLDKAIDEIYNKNERDKFKAKKFKIAGF